VVDRSFLRATSALAGGLAPLAIGLTSGASTPDNQVERVIRRLDTLANGDVNSEF